MNLSLDEYCNSILVLQDQEKKKRVKGVEALKLNIVSIQSLCKTLKSSFGPKSMDKLISSSDGDVTVTNDGSTILSKMEVEHPCAKLLVELSCSQDNEIGDGTTGVVIFASALLEKANYLLDKGLHPLQIASGFQWASNYVMEVFHKIAVPKNITDNNSEILILTAMTSLSSKIVASAHRHLASLAVNAVLSVADLNRKDVNFDLIKVEGKSSGILEDSRLVKGIVLNKEFSHPQMTKKICQAKIAILTCPFEPPKPKTKHKLDIKSVDDYRTLQQTEADYFLNIISAVKKSGANCVICQWGFDDEANHLLMKNNISAVRWVGGVELELIAIATGGRIVSRFEELSEDKLGSASSIEEIPVGLDKDTIVVIEGCPNSKAVTVVLNGTNQIIVEEAKRSFHDAICCIRSLIRNPLVLPGGGAAEIAASIALNEASKTISNVEQCAVEAFADALLSIPETLADNSGLQPIVTVANARKEQIQLHDSCIGVDCMNGSISNMINENVWEPILLKLHQISLATQVAYMILKIDDVILGNQIDE